MIIEAEISINIIYLLYYLYKKHDKFIKFKFVIPKNNLIIIHIK